MNTFEKTIATETQFKIMIRNTTNVYKKIQLIKSLSVALSNNLINIIYLL